MVVHSVHLVKLDQTHLKKTGNLGEIEIHAAVSWWDGWGPCPNARIIENASTISIYHVLLFSGIQTCDIGQSMFNFCCIRSCIDLARPVLFLALFFQSSPANAIDMQNALSFPNIYKLI